MTEKVFHKMNKKDYQTIKNIFMNTDERENKSTQEHHLAKVLGSIHIWAPGVGIVPVGEFMGWNFTVAKGGRWVPLLPAG